MMKLSRIEISGFKSFVDPVTTEFADGITAIVGPNGCGKSNLSEAVTWALGEQSAKFMRSGKMEDVIFNGSQRRRPLGMAEVNLELSTDPGFEHAQDGKLQIGRRVFRTGESQYRLNGKVVSLRQIKDLLMDTGLGIRAYSVIGQGQVETVLSGKPQERRKLIEEAAGITRYKARKRLAELKLEDAAGNLQRLDDVVGELDRSLRSLKRQANAASRYREREAEARELLAAVLVRKRDALDELLVSLREKLAGATDADAKVAAALHRDEARLTADREHVDRLATAVEERHGRITELAARVEGRQEFLKGARATLEDLSLRLGRGDALAAQHRAELATQQQALDALDSRRGELSSERDEAQSAVEQDRSRIEDARRQAETAQASLDTLRAELLDSSARLTALQTRLHQEQIESEKSTYRRDHTAAEIDRLADAVQTAEDAKTAAGQNAENLTARRLDLETTLADAIAVLEATLVDEQKAVEERQQLKQEIVALEQRRQILLELETAAAERRQRIAAVWSDLGLGEPQFLDQNLNVPKGYEDSLDLWLDSLRDAVLLPDSEDPLTAAQALSRSGARGALLQAPGPDAVPLGEIRDAAIRGPVANSLGLPAGFAAGLPAAYLVVDGAAALRLAQRHPGVAFLAPDGIWAQGGLLRVHAQDSAPGTLARRRDLDSIETRLPEARERLQAVGQEIDALVGRRSREAEVRNRIEVDLGKAGQELAVANSRLQEADVRLANLIAQRQQLETNQQSLVEDLSRIEGQRDNLRQMQEKARTEHEQLEKRFDDAQAAMADVRERRELLSTAGAGRQGRLDLLQERLEAHSQERQRIENRLQELEHQTEEWRNDQATMELRREELGQAMKVAETELQEALENRDAMQSDSRDRLEDLAARRDALKALAESVEAQRATHEEGRERIQELRISEASLQQDRSHLVGSYEESFHAALDEAQPPEGIDRALDLGQLEDQLEECRGVLERLGPVNLLAAEEYDEQFERHGFLVEQRTDVEQSVASLKRTIREINQTSSARFKEAFDQINVNFGEVYTNLFRGGEAEMRLLDEDDPLDSGIEIVARPPGKKLQNLMLLSGGEKALTAIALLFALFKTKPSPFCILDEVDAPLDDANVMRFVELVKSYSSDIQFLIISHNKLTMEAASTLYGVTMEEKGVSTIVGVELDRMHPAVEIAQTA